MNDVHTPGKRNPSVGEEIANSLSHGVGFLVAGIGMPFLLAAAARHGGVEPIAGASVFGVTMLLLYLSSTLYHALSRSGARRVLRKLDHSAIYLLIAGTYTPFTLGVLRGPWGWTLFGLVWGLALVGVILKAVGGVRFPVLSTSVYLAMGWLVLVAIRPLWLRVPTAGLGWLLTGGIVYTAGVPFYAAPRLRYAHFVWHLFVLAGTVCHFFAVLGYAA